MMIETKVKFEEVALTTLFASKRFLLEATVEKKLPDMSFTELLTEVRAERGLTKRQTNVTSLLRTHKPVKLIKFTGMRKFSAEWWAAVVRVAPTVRAAMGETDLLLIGWANNHGVEAVCIATGHPAEMISNFDTRILEKTNNEYSLVQEFNDITLGTGVAIVPEIAGMPEPEPMEESWLDLEPAPVPVPPKPAVKRHSLSSMSKTEDVPVDVKGTEKSDLPKPLSKAEIKRRADKEDFKALAQARKAKSDW